jgi:hypothetical protein
MTLDDLPYVPLTVIEYVVKGQSKPKDILPPEVRNKFDKWNREDFIKDDPYKEMWDKNWIKVVSPLSVAPEIREQ